MSKHKDHEPPVHHAHTLPVPPKEPVNLLPVSPPKPLDEMPVMLAHAARGHVTDEKVKVLHEAGLSPHLADSLNRMGITFNALLQLLAK